MVVFGTNFSLHTGIFEKMTLILIPFRLGCIRVQVIHVEMSRVHQYLQRT